MPEGRGQEEPPAVGAMRMMCSASPRMPRRRSRRAPCRSLPAGRRGPRGEGRRDLPKRARAPPPSWATARRHHNPAEAGKERRT
eukprot:676170-Lingulodinium_polyedra.AAC.1